MPTNNPTSQRYREMGRRSAEGRVILPREQADFLREQLRRWPEADPTRSAAWARLWAKLLAPAEVRPAPTGTKEGGA